MEGRESLPWGGSLLSLDFYFARILAAAMQMCSAALLSMLHLCLGCCARLRCLLILQVQATGGRLRASLMRHVYALQDALMNYVLRNCILYNVAWEDPRIDGDLLQLQNDDNVLVLTTGGCNVLDRLIDEPLHIVAVDLNAAQNALLELKLAGLRVLCHEDFFSSSRSAIVISSMLATQRHFGRCFRKKQPLSGMLMPPFSTMSCTRARRGSWRACSS